VLWDRQLQLLQAGGLPVRPSAPSPAMARGTCLSVYRSATALVLSDAHPATTTCRSRTRSVCSNPF
jgi:hypothetical protein